MVTACIEVRRRRPGPPVHDPIPMSHDHFLRIALLIMRVLARECVRVLTERKHGRIYGIL